MRWMKLEPIIQSEVSQKEKDKYCILMHIYMESRKMVMKNLFTGKQWKQCQTLFSGAPKSLQMVIAAMKLKDAYSLEGKL